VVKCDLCDGDPACVRYCPTQAITFRHIDSAAADELAALMTTHLPARAPR